jgi:hypothetical protein
MEGSGSVRSKPNRPYGINTGIRYIDNHDELEAANSKIGLGQDKLRKDKQFSHSKWI